MLFILLLFLFYNSPAVDAVSFANIPGDWNLIWQDEFEGNSVDSTKWNIEGNWAIDSQRNFWVNQNKTRVSNGSLEISVGCDLSTAPVRCDGGGVHSRGLFEKRFGYFEARIKLPEGAGQNPAFWMHSWNMPHIDGSGRDGTEIDIIEKPWVANQFQQTIHWDGYSSNHPTSHQVSTSPNVSDNQYHLISLLWQPDSYKFYIDGTETWSVSNPNQISQVPEFLWFTNAPSEWGGSFTPKAELGKMFIDYVRVYQPNPRPNYSSSTNSLAYQYTYLTEPSTYLDPSKTKLNDNQVPSTSVSDSGWVGIIGQSDGQARINITNDSRILGHAFIQKISFDILRSDSAGIKIPTKITTACNGTVIDQFTPSINGNDNQVVHIIGPDINLVCSNLQLIFNNYYWTFFGEIELVGTLQEVGYKNIILGDANGDNQVNLADYRIWKKELLENDGLTSDFNSDRRVSLADFGVWKREYLKSLQ